MSYFFKIAQKELKDSNKVVVVVVVKKSSSMGKRSIISA